MSVLLIEDSPERVKKFKQHCIGISFIHKKTADAAIAWLQSNTPKVIFLDYDLHDYGADIHETGCGGDVVSWMGKHDHQFQHTQVVIHSLNMSGAARMFAKLQQHNIPSVRMPFIWEHPSSLDIFTKNLRN